VHFADGTFVSPQVNQNFACLQQTGDFCQPVPLTSAQLRQQIDDLTNLAVALKTQSDALSPALQAQVQPWLDQVVQMRLQLLMQIPGNGGSD